MYDKNDEVVLIPNIQTLFLGVVVNLIIIFLILLSFFHFVVPREEFLILLLWTVIIASLVTFGVIGFTNVPIGWWGVPEIFGKRIKKYVLTEGWNWVPFPFMNVTNVDNRHRSLGLNPVRVVSKDKIDVDFQEASTTYRITNPYRILSTDTSVIIDVNLHNLILDEIRRFCVEINAVEIPLKKEEIAEKVRNAAVKVSRNWGIEVLIISIPSIVIPQDIFDVETDAVEVTRILEMADEMKRKFPDEQMKDIIFALQRVLGKVDQISVDVTAENQLERAAGMIVAASRSRQGNGG